jgi:hypothetical protein
VAALLDLNRRQPWAAAVAAGGIALVAWLVGPPAAVLVGAVVSGSGLTYLSGIRLRAEERLAYGTVIGALMLSILDLLGGLARGLDATTVELSLAAALALSLLGWYRGRGQLAADLSEAVRRWRRGEPWPLWLLLLAAWPFTLVLFAHAYTFTPQGLVAGNEGVYADWAAHLTYAGSFAYGRNFPPQFPIDPGHRLAYPFLVDLFAASLVPLGAPLTSALVWTSSLLALALPAVLYGAGLRILGSRGAAALAVAVFTLSGGFGFVWFLEQLARSGPRVLVAPPQLYTQVYSQNLQWLNPVLAWLVPQRDSLFGFSLAALVMGLLWTASRTRAGWVPFGFAGVVAGLTPLAHLHGYGTEVALAAFWALLNRRRQWLAYFLPAILLGAGPAIWMATAGAAQPHLQAFWLADSGGFHQNPLWFWLLNTSLFIPAMVAAFCWRGTLPGALARHLVPIWLWFLVPNFIVFQPWAWDNTKFFSYWLLFGSLAVGALLARLFRRPPTAALAAVLSLTLMLAGAVDLDRTLNPALSAALFTDRGGIELAAWARSHTPATAVFAVAPDHNQPIPTLAGRRVVAGYGGWLWTYGLSDWATRTADEVAMLHGTGPTEALVQRFHVSYVVIGPQELAIGANVGYWQAHGRLVYDRGGYAVYRVS